MCSKKFALRFVTLSCTRMIRVMGINIANCDNMSMRVISNKALTSFSAMHPAASLSVQGWRTVVESRKFASFAELRTAFNAVDKVGDYYVFDVGGNKYRIVTAIHFNQQKLFIRYVLTHQEYDKWKP